MKQYHDEEELVEVEISGDLRDSIRRALTTHIALSGTGRFSMADAVGHCIQEVSDYSWADEAVEKLKANAITAEVNKEAGSRKRSGRSVLRAIRKGSIVTEANKQKAVLQIDKDDFILCKNASPAHVRMASDYWEIGRKQTEVRDKEIEEDFSYVRSLQFDFLGELF